MIELKSSVYRSIKFANTAAVEKGDLVLAASFGGSLNGFVGFADAAADEAAEYVTFAEKAAATKAAADALAFAPGEKVYYNVSGKKVTKSTSDIFIGYAKEAAVADDTEVIVEFDGALVERTTLTLDDISDLDDLTVTKSQVSDLDDLKFADLADVNAAAPTNNDTLKYDTATSKWVVVAVTD